MYSEYSDASKTSKYSMCSQAAARHTTTSPPARPGRRSARSMARRPRLGMSMHQEVACRYPIGHLQATRAAQHHDHGRRRVRLWLSTASRRRGRRLWTSRGLLGWVVVAGAAHPVWTAGHLWGVSCPPTMGTPRDRARARARPQHRGAISCAPAMDGPAHEKRAGQAPAPCRGRALRGRGKDCVRAPVEGPRTRVAELTPCLGAPIVAASHSRVN